MTGKQYTPRRKKHEEPVRRQIAERFKLYKRNSPKRICAEYGIDYKTLERYANEF